VNIFTRRRLQSLRRSPKVFIPSSSGRQIVIPFRPISTLLILFLLFLSGFLFLRSDIFQVKVLGFEFEQLADESLVRQRISEEVLARSIFFLDSGAVEEKIKKDFPTVKEIVIKKILPDQIEAKVTVRVPLAIIEDGSKNHFLVDGEGFIFRLAGDEQLPLISLEGDSLGVIGASVGESGVLGYLETLRLVAEKGLQTVAIYLRGESIELQLAQTVVWLDPKKNITEQIEVLTQILQRYVVAGKTPKSIDLRFGRPVVRL